MCHSTSTPAKARGSAERGGRLCPESTWRPLAEETVAGLPPQTVAELSGALQTITANVAPKRTGTGDA